MKTTFNKIVWPVILLLLAVFAACTEDIPVRDPSPAEPVTQGVYFPAETATVNRTTVELDPTDPTEITLAVSRTDTVNAMEVPLTVTVNDNDVFVVPQTVAFAAKEKTATFKVTFPTADIGVVYKLTVNVQGDEYVNPYATGSQYVSTSVSRVKWDLIGEFPTDTMIVVNGVFGGKYYLPKAEITAGSGDIVNSIRVTGLFDAIDDPEEDPDEYGMNSGCPGVYPTDVVRENAQLVITIDKDDKAVIKGGIGCQWTYDIPEFYIKEGEGEGEGTAIRDANKKIVRIDFPAEALFVVANSAGEGWRSTDVFQIYLSYGQYVEDNKKITDFNLLEYEEIEGAVSDFESTAYEEYGTRSLSKAVDIDAANPASEYKNLYYVADAYASGKGLAFYCDGETVTIPANQPVGKKYLGQDIYASRSTEVRSTVAVTAKGVTVYTLGLQFHYKDGTVLGNFAETFYLSKDVITYSVDDFCGNYTMIGPSMFDIADVNRPVSIEKGAGANDLVIKGIQYAATVAATYDPENSTMSVGYQLLADYTSEQLSLEAMEFLAFDGEQPSDALVMIFGFNMKGQLVLTPASEAGGYMIWSDIINGGAGGWINGYYDLVLSPRAAAARTALAAKSAGSVPAVRTSVKKLENISIVRKEKSSQGNFSIQPKSSRKMQPLTKMNMAPIR